MVCGDNFPRVNCALAKLELAATSESKCFPLIDVRGGPRERGQAHGEACRERIARAFAFYMDDLFAASRLDSAAITTRARRIRELTSAYAPALVDEIEGIAEGCGLPPWKLFVLNARTEILNARVDECTAVYFAQTGVLAQNWDWVEPLEELAVVIRHEHADGHRHLTFCEPGMLAKIGLNSAGIGVCLNILFASHALSGLPVHMLIAALLNARSFAQGREMLENSGLGKASNLLLGDRHGNGLSMEYFGDERHALEPRDGVLIHTNHCLAHGDAGRVGDLENSCARYDLVDARLGARPERDLATAKDILLGSAGGENSVMRPYRPQTVLGTHRVGTCACIVMELAAGRMHIRRGPGNDDRFSTLLV